MQILCTGASGIVGYNFIKSATEVGYKVIALYNTTPIPPMRNLETIKMDLLDLDALQALVLERFPDAIVNCAAIASPDDVEANPSLAEKLNVKLPQKLAILANHISARFLHLSTDMVFDGSSAPYKNTDMPMPTTTYGQTKLLAEKEVLKFAAPLSVVLRVSHVSGNSLTRRRSLHEKFLFNWKNGLKSICRKDEFKAPLSATRLADLLVELLERPQLSGIYHFAGLETISKYDMAYRIAKHFKLDPDEFIQESVGDSEIDLTLDISAINDKVKQRSSMFGDLLEEMEIPEDIHNWLLTKTSGTPIRRFKL